MWSKLSILWFIANLLPLIEPISLEKVFVGNCMITINNMSVGIKLVRTKNLIPDDSSSSYLSEMG